jgi:hypothetical protein
VFTPRETAASIHHAAASMGTGHVPGIDPDQLREERLRFTLLALARVRRAFGTERRFLAEPSDEQLDAMQTYLMARRDQLATQ